MATTEQVSHRRSASARCGWSWSTQQEHGSQWAAITSIAEKLGCAAETLRSWVRRAERDAGPAARADDGRASSGSRSSSARTSELRRANEILRKASAFFAQAELDRRAQVMVAFIDALPGRRTGSSRSARCCRSPRRRTTSARRGATIPRAPASAARRDEVLREQIRRVWRREPRGLRRRARCGGSSSAKGRRGRRAARWSA